jgi:hypothetical protein
MRLIIIHRMSGYSGPNLILPQHLMDAENYAEHDTESHGYIPSSRVGPSAGLLRIPAICGHTADTALGLITGYSLTD